MLVSKAKIYYIGNICPENLFKISKSVPLSKNIKLVEKNNLLLIYPLTDRDKDPLITIKDEYDITITFCKPMLIFNYKRFNPHNIIKWVRFFYDRINRPDYFSLLKRRYKL